MLIETWQANAAGRYNHPADRQDKALDNASAAGRGPEPISTPGFTPSAPSNPAAWWAARAARRMAPHVNFWLASRGINIGLATRMYFGDEEAANAEDPVLNIIEQPERRKTLIAPRSERGRHDHLHFRYSSSGRAGNGVLRRLKFATCARRHGLLDRHEFGNADGEAPSCQTDKNGRSNCRQTRTFWRR